MPSLKANDSIDSGINIRSRAMQRFRGRTVLITGAGGAIGRAAATRFAWEGARLALVDRDAEQVARYRIRVNAICPGIIQTPLSLGQKAGADAAQFFARFAARIPLGRVGQPEDVAAAVAFLASDQACQITGTALLIDGGQTMRRWISAPDLIAP